MSASLSAERDRIQRQVELLEQSLSATHPELVLLSSETDDSDGDDSEQEVGQSAAGLLAQREKIQREIQNLENVLGPRSPVHTSDDDSSSEESELGLSLSVESCLQMNLVYQQVVQETLDQLETLLTHNHRQQEEVVTQLSGPIKESSRGQHPPTSCEQPIRMFMGNFLKPYFKDKLTGLGPPANQETKEKAGRMLGCLDAKKLKVKRWESWQKTLLIHSVARDGLKRLVQPKLSRVDYLSQKLSSAGETDRQQLREQIDSLERGIELLRVKKEEELIGDRYEEHDWQKIANIDFEGTRDVDDIRSFWQNFLHPSINKDLWSQEEVQQLKEVSRRHGERDWEAIATELGTGRTAFLCLQTFQRFVSDSLRRGAWTPAEDQLLRELVDRMRIGNFIPYTQMSYFIEGRDPAQLIYRWNQVLDPSLKKGPWTKEEDQLLLQAVSCYGERDWWKIRLMVPGRTDGGCRDRYYDCLKVGTKRGPFDTQERELLLKLVEKHGVGRWAKIAAEIPHRVDAQCLREWRRLNKPAQKHKEAKETPTCQRAKTTRTPPVRRRIRNRLRKIKEEEEISEEEEEEDMVVVYMDSDEEEKKTKNKTKEDVKVSTTEEVETEEEEEEYSIPPLQDWIPAEKVKSSSILDFQPVELPSSGDVLRRKHVRSTILGRFGRSVIIGPSPRVLKLEEHHCNKALMMVSPDQLQAHLRQQAKKLSSGHRQKVQNKQKRKLSGTELEFKLRAAVTPWIGNLLIPETDRLTAADVLREQGEKTKLSSTSVFLLLLQAMNVDSAGCKETIEQRNKTVTPPSSPPGPPCFRTKNPRPDTVAAILQQHEADKHQQASDTLKELILEQLQGEQQRQKQQQKPLIKQPQSQELMLLQQLPPPRPPLVPPPRRPNLLLQMPPNMHPQMSPASRPQPVLISSPVAKRRAASRKSRPRSTLTRILPAPRRPPPAVIVSSQLPAPPPSPQRLNVPPVSAVPLPSNTTSSDSVQQQAELLTEKVRASPPPPPNQHVSVGSAPPSQQVVASTRPKQPSPAPSPSSFISNPLQEGVQKETQQADGSRLHGPDLGAAGDRVTEEGKRVRKLSLKAKDLQEASDARAKMKEKAASSSRKKAQIKSLSAPAQKICTAPVQMFPQTAAPTRPPAAPSPLKLNLPPGSVSSTPVCSDATVSSTQSSHLAPPPSTPTNQHTASSTAGFRRDHDYCDSGHKQSQDYANSAKRRPASRRRPRRKTDSAPKRSPKAPPKRRKQVSSEGQPGATSSQDGHSAGRTGDVGGTLTGVTQDGKRLRKPSQKARAAQEAVREKAEAKRRRSSSSPPKKRSRSSKQKILTQKQLVAQQPCLPQPPPVWIMTPGVLVPVAEAPPSGMQLALVPGSSPPAPPRNILHPQPSSNPLQLAAGTLRLVSPPPTVVTLPVNLPTTKPRPFSAPPLGPTSPSPPRSILQPPLPCEDTVRADPLAPPPHRREVLQFDPSLMFLDSRAEVSDWLSGRGGVAVPGEGVALPYLPPFVSSLSMLSALLKAKKSLTTAALQGLCRGFDPQHPHAGTTPDNSTGTTTSQPSDLPDSTSDLRPAANKPAPSVSLQQEEADEEERVAAVRQLVAERFSSNPAYQMLKARFLSCFTLPALLATMQPITERTGAPEDSDEDEEEEDGEEVMELKKLKERGKQRRAERSLLLCESGAPASHFSGVIDTNTPSSK